MNKRDRQYYKELYQKWMGGAIRFDDMTEREYIHTHMRWNDAQSTTAIKAIKMLRERIDNLEKDNELLHKRLKWKQSLIGRHNVLINQMQERILDVEDGEKHIGMNQEFHQTQINELENGQYALRNMYSRNARILRKWINAQRGEVK